MAKNKLVVVGAWGKYLCYLNIDKDEAIRRYKKENDLSEDSLRYTFTTKEFEDVFEVSEDHPYMIGEVNG